MACCKIPTEFLDSPYPHLPSLDSALLYSFACSYFPTKTCASAPAIEIIRCTRSFTAICDWLHERLETGCDGPDLPSRSERTGTSRECGSLCEGRDVHIQKLMLLVISAPVHVFLFLQLSAGFVYRLHLDASMQPLQLTQMSEPKSWPTEAGLSRLEIAVKFYSQSLRRREHDPARNTGPCQLFPLLAPSASIIQGRRGLSRKPIFRS